MNSCVERLLLEQLCGQLLVVGFDGTELPPTVGDAIRAGHRGGVILFKRNLPDLETTWKLCRTIGALFPPGIPAFIGLDEEGGRVSRLPRPFKALPAMRDFGDRDDPTLTYRAATWLGQQLAALGFTCNFAPVLDVDSNPRNPIIGNRSFATEPATVTRHGLAFIDGLQSQGIAACGKHYPGHGDTALDSHIALPTVAHSFDRLAAIELAPFRACASSAVFGMMTAHVAYPGLDPTGTPATFSYPIITELLRDKLGFSGVLFSDDLEMGAVSCQRSVENAACRAVQAGCDALLICHSEAAADRALESMVKSAERDESFRIRVKAAAARFIEARGSFSPRPATSLDALRLDAWEV